MDVIRSLLLKLEALPIRGSSIAIIGPHDTEVAVEGATPDEIEYHLQLIRKHGLIESPGSQPLAGGMTFRSLTWEGHDFLDSIRDDEVWRKTKKSAEAAGSWTMDIIVGLGKASAKAKLTELTGLSL
jgi:hypothetical protein